MKLTAILIAASIAGAPAATDRTKSPEVEFSQGETITCLNAGGCIAFTKVEAERQIREVVAYVTRTVLSSPACRRGPTT